MATKTFYTAVGRFERRRNGCGRCCPVIILGGKEYMVDMQEMVIWTNLNWRISRKEEIGALYQKACLASDFIAERTWEACVERLVVRGLLVCGAGATEYDALYDLLAALYIIPAEGSLHLRLLSFCKLTLLNRVPLSAARKLFHKDKRTASEKQVMQLARQALLSTAEIIKCVEKGIHHLPNEDSILTGIYNDRDTTSDNISSMVKASPSTEALTLAVANLYLRQQIIFERI